MAEGFNSKNVGQVEIKKNQFNLSHTHNTTAPFGSVQCINMQYIPLGNTTVNFKVSSIVRLLPLIFPCVCGCSGLPLTCSIFCVFFK